MGLRSWTGFVGLCVGLTVHGQQYGFTPFTPQDGLAQSQVRCMAEDAEGYLWFGTLGGASRFDGSRFVNYALQEGLPDAQVNAMLSARDGTLWMACGSALATFDGQRLQTLDLPSTAQGKRVLALAEGVQGEIYIATDGDGVLRWNGNSFSALEGYPLDTAANPRALFTLPDGDLLIGLRNGLLRWHQGQSRAVEQAGTGSVSALACGKDGTIWVGTFGDGLRALDPAGGVRVLDETNGLLQKNIRSLLVDDRDRVWVGTKFGVNLLDAGRIRAFTVHQGMPNDNIPSLYQDRSGNIWLGTDGAGVLRYAGERFVTFTVKEGLCSDLVMCVVNDPRGDQWLGTYGNGICRMDGMATLTATDGLPNNTIWCGIPGQEGDMWFGTSNGICRVAQGRVVPMDSVMGLTGYRVLSMHRTNDGHIWCGMREGLAILSDGGIEQHTSFGDMLLRSIRALAQTPDGAMWLGTEQGVVRKMGNKVDRWTSPAQLSDNTVFCLRPDRKGRIWAGTSNGLNCIDGDRTVVVRLGSDFGSNYIGFLLADDQGALWAGTNNGLYRFDPDSLLRYPDHAEHITLEDGLRGMECNLNAAFRDERGRLFFGTNGGLVLHDPARTPRTRAAPPPEAHITALRSFLLPTEWKGMSESIDERTGLPVGLNLPFRKNHLTFDYTAIALSDAGRLRFQYRLAGFDPGWLPPTDARFATYSNLPHGHYVFELRASDRAGEWGATERFSFVIQPPFWLRWWFFAACGIATAGIAYGVQRYRHLRRQRTEKTRQLMLRSRMLQLEQQALNANMNRHFIFNALNSIQYYINRQDRTAANRYLTSFAKLIRKNLDASQSDTVSLHEELERLELYLMLEHMRFKDKFHYVVQVDSSVNTRDIDLPAMMLQPYVENSIWHGILPMGRPGKVTITVTPLANAHVRVTIADDGIGIERSLALKNGAEGDHISRGIEITKGRADVLRRLDLADIRIVGPEQVPAQGDEPGGTQVLIDLPTREEQPPAATDLHFGPGALTFEG
jgi:ligand-binding sensor domain-containing protein/two-component sensor histidine kinase